MGERLVVARLIALGSLCALLGACGGSGGGGDSPETGPAPNPPPSPPPVQGNSAPIISGAPAAATTQGSPYDFLPTASDPDGDALSFTVQNAPPWASFDPKTGELSGSPSAADVGGYSNITISVSDGQLSASLPPFTIQVMQAGNGSAQLSWLPPTTHTDGSALTDIAGYRVYYGQNQGNYPIAVNLANPGLASYVIENLTAGTWYFVVTAVDSSGAESGWSNEATKIVQ